MTLQTFRDAMRQQDFVITAELPLWPTSTAPGVRAMVEGLASAVDAFQIGSDQDAVGHMSALAAAGIILQSGFDTVVHCSARDRNRIALMADILGAAALGVTSMILSRGEKFADTAPMRGKGVFEIGATKLIRMANSVSREPDVIADPGFHIGSLIVVFEPAADWKAERIKEKIDAGVKFLQTQPCLNADLLREYMHRLVELKIMHRASVVAEVPLLTSAGAVRALKEKYKGVTIPDVAVKKISASNDPVAEGVAVCAQMIADVRSIPGVSGVNIRYDGEPEHFVTAVCQAATGS